MRYSGTVLTPLPLPDVEVLASLIARGLRVYPIVSERYTGEGKGEPQTHPASVYKNYSYM